MRQMLKGLVVAVAVMAAAPAMACGYAPCAAPVVSYGYAGWGCSPCGWGVRERLPDPVQQYYWVNQGPTYTGPGNFAPYPVYREATISGYGYGYNRPYYRAHRHYHGHRYSYSGRYYHGRPVLRRYY